MFTTLKTRVPMDNTGSDITTVEIRREISTRTFSTENSIYIFCFLLQNRSSIFEPFVSILTRGTLRSLSLVQ